MSTGKGIAIAGIWISVAICAFVIGSDVVVIAFFATIATAVVT